MKTQLHYRQLLLCLLAMTTWQVTQAANSSFASVGANLAPAAEPSASFTSGDTSVKALNDEATPRRSRDRRQGAYGNWPHRGTEWVEYRWDRPISTEQIEVYWWDDRQGVRWPETCKLLFWDGQEYVPVTGAEGHGVELDKFNVTTFDKVQTKRLRLQIDSRGEFSTGILEWRVLDSGESPPLPPRVEAGVDRVAVLGSETFLMGEVRAFGGPDSQPSCQWTKQAGPGEVNFADPTAAETTASFSQPGMYTLELTATHHDLSASSTLQVLVKPAAPEHSLRMVETLPYKITSPLWQPRLKATIVHWIPHCITKIEDPELREGGLNNFIDAAKKLRGEPHERHRGYWFSNAWVYNVLESMCWATMFDADGDQEIQQAQQSMRETIDEWIPIILAAQEPDGYLQTLFTISGDPRWTDRVAHEGYVAGYFLECAVAHHLMTEGQDDRLYQAAKRLADCWDNHLGPPPKQGWYDGHQAMEQALARFGRYVNQVENSRAGDKYLALAKFLLDQRQGGSEYDQSHLPVIQQYEAVGHAVRAVYNYSAMCDVVLATRDLQYQSAVESLWDNIVNRKYYVTGGVGSGETSEGFGPDYSLRSNSYCESCSGCGELFFQHKMNLIHHDAQYADLFEETLYNAILGDLDLAGKNFYYQNPLDSRNARYDWHVCPCCVGNIPRVLLMLPSWMYAVEGKALYVNLYVGSEVQVGEVAGTEVKLTQATDYPWDGQVKITVDCQQPATFALKLRSPHRDVSKLYSSSPSADGIEAISVNGSAVEPDAENGYVTLKRLWKAGDQITLTLPLEPQRVYASPRIAALQSQVALRYGPLIYNLESVDQDVTKSLAPDAEITAEWQPELLDGVLVLRGKFTDGSEMMAIPNYARQNRREDDQRVRSIVWIREGE